MKPRIAVIGAGAWGANHVRVTATEPRCELVAVADHDERACDRAHVLAPRAAITRDPDRILADPSIDAVIIATPASTHVELAVAARAAGKHVLVEKPVALSLASAHRLDTPGPAVLMIGHLMVFHPAVVRMKELLRTGELGQLQYIHCTRANLGRIRADESVLWSFGPHDLSMLDFLLEQEPVDVTAQGRAIHHDGVHDVAFVTLTYATKELAQLHLSRVHPQKLRSLTLVGADKLVHFDDVGPEKLRIYPRGRESPPFTEFGEFLGIRDGAVYIPDLAMAEPLRLQLHHFIDCIVDGRQPRTDLASGLRILRVLEQARRAPGGG